MTDLAGIAQLITSVVLVATFAQSYNNGRKLSEVREQTDGITQHLVKVTAEAEFAKGKLHGEDHPRPKKRT